MEPKKEELQTFSCKRLFNVSQLLQGTLSPFAFFLFFFFSTDTVSSGMHQAESHVLETKPESLALKNFQYPRHRRSQPHKVNAAAEVSSEVPRGGRGAGVGEGFPQREHLSGGQERGHLPKKNGLCL